MNKMRIESDDNQINPLEYFILNWDRLQLTASGREFHNGHLHNKIT